MKLMVFKFFKPGETVMDTCCGTFATGKTCLLLQNRRIFISSYSSVKYVEAAFANIMHTFDLQDLNLESDIE